MVSCSLYRDGRFLMDIPRYGIARNRKLWTLSILVLLAFALTAVAYGVSRLDPAAHSVDGATLWRARVHRGAMLSALIRR